MQRRATKHSPGATQDEKAYISWTKEQPCICCSQEGPSIFDHCRGSTYKVKVDLVSRQIGHWFGIPLCIYCDSLHTNGSVRRFENEKGPQHELWEKNYQTYKLATGKSCPEWVIRGIVG